MKQAILIPNGRRVSLAAYAAAWRLLKRMDPQDPVRGWTWYHVTAGSVLRQMRAGLEDRINTRGGLVVRPTRSRDDRRTHRALARRGVVHECRECGSSLGRYVEHPCNRFCCADCCRAYRGF
jgi:hypothetical protein